MTVEAMDIDSNPGLSLEGWLGSSEAQDLQRTLEEKILRFLFSTTPDDHQYQQMVQQLAWIGSKAKPLIAREIVELNTGSDSLVLHCGLGKQLRKSTSKICRFIAEHKTAILVGAGLCATGIGLAAVLGYSLTMCAGGIAVAGAGCIFDSKDKQTPNPKIPNIPSPSSSVEVAIGQQPFSSLLPKLDLPSIPNELLVNTEGIWANGQYYPTSDLMKGSLVTEELSKYPSTSPNYLCDSSKLFENQNPFLPSPQNYLGDVAKLSEDPPLHSNIVSSKTDGEGKNDSLASLPNPWRGDFSSPSDLAPNSLDPITGKPKYNDSRSRKFTILGKESSGLHIGWINGVNNSFEDSKDNGTYLQKLTGGYTVCGVYNCSHTIVWDVLEAGVLNYPGYSPNAARLLQNNWKAFHEANLDRPNAKFLQVCHSQGAIHVRNALERSPQEIRDRLMVVAAAPAAVVPKRLCFKSFNYASEKDFIYKLEPAPSQTVPYRLDGVIVPAVGEAIDDRGELIILEAHSEAQGIDHEFQSLTYQDALIKLLEDYKEHKGEYLPDENGN